MHALFYILKKSEMVLVAVVPFLRCAGLIFCLLEVITVLIYADSGVITHPDYHLMTVRVEFSMNKEQGNICATSRFALFWMS
jgi:hypothetical protein